MAYDTDEACNNLGLSKDAYPISIKDLGYKGDWKKSAVNGVWCGIYHSPTAHNRNAEPNRADLVKGD